MKYFRGWIGEQKTRFYLWLSLRNKTYCKFNNLILPSTNGTTQIDHLIVSVFGLFIVETKNKKGWIFGSDQQDFWTQIIYAKKHSFQNPLRQVYRQKKILSGKHNAVGNCLGEQLYLAFGFCLPKSRVFKKRRPCLRQISAYRQNSPSKTAI